ncbi:MAG: adenosylcobinamide-phosphate synthase CbiB [Thermodesulfobacteriota bacterium]|nr:adenosylcobinamide-phosphate synthase CbiB [Thermodesulfobacteriota bacterium]
MMESCGLFIILPAAVVLDLIVGDPLFLPHPIRWMGKAIERFEPAFRKNSKNLTVYGTFFALILIISTWIMSFGLVVIARKIHPVVEMVLQTVLIYWCISVRSLRQAAMEVKRSLVRNKIEEAKIKLSCIVGRDVKQLTERGMIRACVETVAENLVDGVIAPLFFAVIGGAPLALTYKMVNTLDSMVGYKNETYVHFGKAAARIDDVANYVPARLSVPIISLSAQLVLQKGWRALKTAIKEGKNHSSPNAGFPEASFAGAMGIKLGGPNYYHGRLVHKPFIGEFFGEAEIIHIKKACDLMVLSSVIWLVTLCGVTVFLFLF